MASPSAVSRFDGEYRFLSNFYPARVQYLELVFPTVEHAYQAAKCASVVDVVNIYDAKTPGEAKRLGRTVNLRRNWEEMKLGLMRGLLEQKFSQGVLQDLLLATGEVLLIEGNDWGDRYWGVCNGKGHNWLGRLLMDVRAHYRSSR